MENKIVTRRRALKVIGMTTGGLVLVGCKAEDAKTSAGGGAKPAPQKAPASKPAAAAAPAAAADDCKVDVPESQLKLRQTLQYVEKTEKEGQQCNNCLQYIAPEAGKKCGGCKLFAGPVQPAGYCLSWAAKAS